MYIDEGASAPFDAIGKAMSDFAGSAAAGQFAVNQSGGDALLAAIKNMIDWVREQQGSLLILKQEPKLGSSNSAEAIKPFNQQVASDAQGFLTQLTAFAASLEKAEQGIRQAMANYQNTDQLNQAKYA